MGYIRVGVRVKVRVSVRPLRRLAQPRRTHNEHTLVAYSLAHQVPPAILLRVRVRVRVRKRVRKRVRVRTDVNVGGECLAITVNATAIGHRICTGTGIV